MKMKRWMSVLLCTILITAAVPSFSLSAAAASEEGDRTASDISDLKEMLESEDSLIDRITGKHDEEEEDSEQSLTIVSSTTTEDADDLSLKSGDKLPLFVLVSGGESPYTYSWLIRRGEDDSWHEIGTDAAVSYTIGSADNGAEIQCIVKDAKGGRDSHRIHRPDRFGCVCIPVPRCLEVGLVLSVGKGSASDGTHQRSDNR